MSNETKSPFLEEDFFLGGFRIQKHLFEGRFWNVYLAHNSSNQHIAALKVLKNEVPKERCDALLAKARELRALQHPGVVQVFESGQESGYTYFAEEWIEGANDQAFSLERELRNHGGRLPADTLRLRIRQIWEAMRFAHCFGAEGFSWNGIDSTDILLTPQRRVKLLDPGLKQILAGTVVETEEAKVQDSHAIAQLLHSALTGTDNPHTPPSSLGFAKSWDKVLQLCFSASPGHWPDERTVLEAVMASDIQKNSPVFSVIIALVFLILIGLGIFSVKKHLDRRREQQEEVEKITAETHQDGIRKFLEAAETEVARLHFSNARKIVNRVLENNPENIAAKRLLQDITTAQGIATISTIKNQADEAWSRIRDLDPEQGMGTLIDSINNAYSNASKSMDKEDYPKAKKLFASVVSQVTTLEKLDAQRDEADMARAKSVRAREGAIGAEAEEFSKQLWEKAEAQHTAAQTAFTERKFTTATQIWKQSLKIYERAGTTAEQRRNADYAKATLESEIAKLTEGPRPPKEILRKAAGMATEAKTAYGQANFTTAGKIWNEAAGLLRQAREQAKEKAHTLGFTEALAQGRELLAQKQWEKSEHAFQQALSQPGRSSDPVALQLLQKVRDLRRQADANTAWTDDSGNMVLNHNFEQGKNGIPLHWTKPDNLTVYWEKCGVKGYGLRLDSDVYRSEWEEHRKHPDVPMKKTITKGTKYNTVGGTAGVAVYSRPIIVQPDGFYQIEYDVKGPGGEPFLYVKGFWKCGPQDLHKMGGKMFFKPFRPGPSYSLMAMGTSGEEKRNAHPGDYIQCFRRRLVARLETKNEWRHFKTIMQFKADRNIEVVLLELYAFWPPGDYYFDNVTMRQVSQKDAEKFEAWRKQMGKAANFGTPTENIKK